MKAIVAHEFGGPDVMKLEEVADPAPGPGEVVVAVRAAGVNPVDTYILSGVHLVKPPLPYTPGGDAGGVVVETGAGVTGLAAGDRVCVGAALGGGMTGCYAEKVVRPADCLVRLPDNVGFAEAAALGVPYATAHYGLFARGGAQAGETVFIHGASGAVGTAAIQLGKRAGLKVIGSAGSQRGLDLVAREGADEVVDHGKPGYMDEVKRLAGGEGPALILEMLANVNLAADMELAPKYGRIVVIGSRGEITIAPRAAMAKDLDIRGLVLFNARPDQMKAIIDDLMAGLADGSLSPVIGREMKLAEAAAAHRAVLEPGAYGKLVLTP